MKQSWLNNLIKSHQETEWIAYIICDCPDKQRINLEHWRTDKCSKCGQLYSLLGACAYKGERRMFEDIADCDCIRVTSEKVQK